MKALLSVHDKELLGVFADGLIRNGYDVFCTEGTNAFLRGKGLETHMTSEITGFSEMLDGKIKTIHPDIHYMIATGEISVMAVNLLPLALKGDSPLDSMDIGGVNLIRSGIKNWRNVCVLTDSKDYLKVLNDIRGNGIRMETRHECAIKAIKTVMTYDWNVLETLKNLDL